MEQSLGTKLRRLLALLDGDVQAIYDEMEITFRPRFFPIVQLLLRNESCSIVELAHHLAVSQPAATQTVSEMKRLGLLTSADSADRRQRPVQLTVAGREMARRLKPVWDAADRAAANLNAELDHGLGKPIDDALAALEARRFRERVRKQMERR
jgi:DNA-binding MarR family transcriptional regulator